MIAVLDFTVRFMKKWAGITFNARLEKRMSESPNVGAVAWTDLTVSNAEEVRDFYGKVVGWTFQTVSMGAYDDFSMVPPGGGNPVAGICHARGANADIPPVWLVYLLVENLEKSLAACLESGGQVLAGPTSMGPGSAFAVIRDPAGAVAALYQMGD